MKTIIESFENNLQYSEKENDPIESFRKLISKDYVLREYDDSKQYEIRTKYHNKQVVAYLVHENGSYDIVPVHTKNLNEVSISQAVVVGGIGLLIYNWLTKTKGSMKKTGIKFGDTVTRKTKNAFGKMTKESGVVVNRDGYAQVLIKNENGITRYVRWDSTWKK